MARSFTCVVAEDETLLREALLTLLSEVWPELRVVAACDDGGAALEAIAEHQPDVAFLDIQMPELSGIDLAASLPDPAPLVVFVTAYDQYAVQAFDANAIDYLLKPYDQARLRRALERLRERLQARTAQTLPPFVGEHALGQLLVTERGVTRVIRIDQIGWIETADNYVVLHTAGKPLMRQTLAGLLDKLGPGFMRCHRRAAVQLAWIERVEALDKGDCELVLRDGARVPCSRQYRAALMERL